MAAYRASARGGRKGGKFELTEEQRQEIREAFDLFDTGEPEVVGTPEQASPSTQSRLRGRRIERASRFRQPD